MKYGVFKRHVSKDKRSLVEPHRFDAEYQTIFDPPPDLPADENGNFPSLTEWKPGQPKPATGPPNISPPKGIHIATDLRSGELNHG